MIKIDDDYTIEPDTYGWRLVYSEKRTPKNGTPYIFQDSWNFVSIEQAMKKYVDLGLKEVKSLTEAISKIESLHSMLSVMCPKIIAVNGKIKQ